ncbi:MAG: hypothetical protein WA988_15885 [Candidatus Nanopelagicales bacterium]
MATYGLWKSIRHYMVAGQDPGYTAPTADELASIAFANAWYAPAVIAQNINGEWVPQTWVRKTFTKSLTPDQPQKYMDVRAGVAPWPTHLGGPLKY